MCYIYRLINPLVVDKPSDMLSALPGQLVHVPNVHGVDVPAHVVEATPRSTRVRFDDDQSVVAVTSFKMVYAPGAFLLKDAATIVGADVEVTQPDGATKRGAVKQFHAATQCHLVRYEAGGKDWIDLDKCHFKVCVACAPSPWYVAGAEIELYSLRAPHTFQEGAVVCRHFGATASLYNNSRGTFEMQPATTPHKVVLHGLHGGRDIPAGSCVEIYSTSHGTFRTGHVLKRASQGALVPLRFLDSDTLEWVDLSSMTLKLVLFPGQRPVTTLLSPRGFSFPTLPPGTHVDVYRDGGYCKCSVVAATTAHHVYEIRDARTDALFRLDLARAKCKVRIPHSADLALFRDFVVEVYVKAARRVDTGRVSDANVSTKMLQIRYDGGRTDWVHIATTKVKVRLPRDSDATPESLAVATKGTKPPLLRAQSSTHVLPSPPRPSLLRRAVSFTRSLQRTPLALQRRASITPRKDAEWKMHIDPATHRTCYVHVPTGRQQWQPPPDADLHELQWLEPEPYEIAADVSPIQIPVGPLEAVRHSRQTGLSTVS
ncbi:hypothetical protein SDRG_13714 [Saprolegnia diclina VS20]|uniref:WW domain-containing protein n=1 Tax=Saprolegnia diclina (strain VS20) TaxID=1156394 RepID=T0Q254_SAPDV|nr:hypothetical protein SDRG_13714 [Saprolegnia diclina VS20]EQC28636.1 hypothetical protein SDRG_13714 [Saprolegnia diclina VS20]|eukprot:XP_008618033.1 hypothetical protein SDRG_13714 [Saprolegnia diclina VS20]